uniref:Uncharacterized protein n=1 Tax=Anguilla anguilla TaxID=7936 RepID=A0A0E9V8B1_ANGAN
MGTHGCVPSPQTARHVRTAIITSRRGPGKELPSTRECLHLKQAF